MKLRDFIKTVPALGAVLALPAKAEPELRVGYGPKQATGDSRGWWSEVDLVACTATFTAIERCANGDRSHSTITVSGGIGNFADKVREAEEQHSRWCAHVGEHPYLLRFPKVGWGVEPAITFP